MLFNTGNNKNQFFRQKVTLPNSTRARAVRAVRGTPLLNIERRNVLYLMY